MEYFTVFIGLIATVTSTIAFLPQALYVIRTKDTKSLSLSMYIIFVTSVIAWEIYGLLLKDLPIIIANIVCIIASTIILYYKVMEVLNKKENNNE
ncbi:MAG: SemiSWEET transporter [Anaerocolumna sp.]